jgi:hypothetical protein
MPGARPCPTLFAGAPAICRRRLPSACAGQRRSCRRRRRRSRISALTLTGPESFGFFTGAIDNYLAAVGEVVPTLSDAGMMRGFSSLRDVPRRQGTGRPRTRHGECGAGRRQAARRRLDAPPDRHPDQPGQLFRQFPRFATPEQKAALTACWRPSQPGHRAMRKQVLDKAAEAASASLRRSGSPPSRPRSMP